MEETSKIAYTSTLVHMGPVSKDLSQQSAKKITSWYQQVAKNCSSICNSNEIKITLYAHAYNEIACQQTNKKENE